MSEPAHRRTGLCRRRLSRPRHRACDRAAARARRSAGRRHPARTGRPAGPPSLRPAARGSGDRRGHRHRRASRQGGARLPARCRRADRHRRKPSRTACTTTQPRLLIVNKFGKIEADGGGLREAIAEAVDLGIPVLVGVPARNLDRWRAFAGAVRGRTAGRCGGDYRLARRRRACRSVGRARCRDAATPARAA